MGQSSTHPWTVLVVDDSESIRVALRLYLEADGYAVEEASDGLRAFVRLSHRDTRYLVLLDHAMPELDGWELLQLAIADPRLLAQHTFIVMTTQAETPIAFARFLADHAIPRLVKPVGRRDLRALLPQAEARLSQSRSATTLATQFPGRR